PANGYPVRAAVRRVDDLELREHALAADVGQPEPLLAPELAPQLRLPRLQREAGWPVHPRQPGRPAARGTAGGHGSHRRCAAVKLHGTPSKGRRTVKSAGIWFNLTSIGRAGLPERSEEHTSELQSRFDLVWRLLLEKKKKADQSLLLWLRTVPLNFRTGKQSNCNLCI